MKVLLLAAGLGTRLQPLTFDIPKCLVPINGRPLLDYWLEMMFNANMDSVLVNLHHMAEKVRCFIDESPYKGKVTAVYEEELLGTAGTLLKNKAFFGKDQILLVHADNFSLFDLNEFIRAHGSRPKACEMTMMTFTTDTPESCGILELDNEKVVTAFHEKVSSPPGNLANGAVYILENSIFSFLESLGEEKMDFSTQVLPFFLGRIFTFHNNRYHRDIGTMENYQKAQERL
ncbi:MAG: nucleotidyltransferase family protein [Proteobacteria bacterium]|nr:nucleotidyltransferase family protein [Pseudomonadota bacterium]MBU1585379.1 nucleotidyltransferase family protein [Pseudomonadota bacterium]MBU2456265.1 nucleotidyltransferase family protein [Pseudomonadota bacterium]MBU2632022.1 nucleotidyltransferase family protein [Pseudomonadota bacterium]